MKKKIFISLILSLCLVFGSTTVFAENSKSEDDFSSDEYYDEYIYDNEHINDDLSYDENTKISEYDEDEDETFDSDVSYDEYDEELRLFFNNDTLFDQKVYFYDASSKVPYYTTQNIYNELYKTAFLTGNNIAFYIDDTKRSDNEIDKFSSWGLDYIFLSDSLQKNNEISVFVYFDMQYEGKINIHTKSVGYSDYIQSTDLDNIIQQMQDIADKYPVTENLDNTLTSCTETFCDSFDLLTQNIIQIPAQRRSLTGRAPETYYNFDYYKDNTVYYNDESGIFNKQQRQKIIDLLKDTSRKIGFNLAVYTAGYNRSDSQVEDFTERGAMEIFGLDTPNGTIFLYVDLDGYSNPCDSMYCYHQPFLYYTSELFGNRIDKILEAMQKHFPKSGEEIYPDNIYAGLQEYCDQLIKYKDMGMEDGCYYYDSAIQRYIVVRGGKAVQTQTVHWVLPLIIAIIIGLIVFLAVYFGVKHEYKFKSSASASEYTSGNSTHLNVKNDIFLGSHVTKTHIQHSSGHGGSHHRSGSFHGGGHSGGGGGSRHR